jgi:hypothetical protein
VVPIALFGLAFATLAWSLTGLIAGVRSAGTAEGFVTRLSGLLGEPGPQLVLAPFRLLLAPVVADSVSAWALPFAGALALLALHFMWVLRTDAAFEETAAAEGERRAAFVAAVRAGGLARARFAARNRGGKSLARPWLPLRSTGNTAYAILWKNVLLAQRSIRSARGLLMVLVIVTTVIVLGDGGSGDSLLRGIASLLLIAAATLTIFGPFAVRNDLRTDLRHIETLRTYPVRSRDLVAAEVAAPVLALTLPQLILTAGAIIMLGIGSVIGAGAAAMLLAAASIVLPVVNALAVLIQNVLALLYPSWVRLGPHGAGGIETVGQNMIVMIGTMLILLLCALPPLVAGVLVGAPLTLLVGPAAIAAGIVAGAAAGVGEIALITIWLGRLFDRTDPVEAGLLS